jgi:2,7-dihydroxy-5-methyl-1-naphthoate 7-O-methyltransferase
MGSEPHEPAKREPAEPEPAEPEPAAPDLAALTDLCTPWCVHVAATLRLAEHIDAGASAIDDLAAAAGCDARALHAMLEHLVSKGVFTSPAPGRFAVNAAARQLSNPFLDLGGIGGRMAGAWSTLPTFVRTGSSGYAAVFGRPFWADLAAHPQVAADFDRLMGPDGHGTPCPDIGLAEGWDGVRTVADVGGGTGSMLTAILQARPGVRGILVDLPGTVARASFAEPGVAERVTVAGQSFFDPLPAGADLYLLRKVLNDWPEAETVRILRRCAEAARPSGLVVVIGGVSPDEAAPMLAIDMVVTGGTTNSLGEFRGLAREAGLEVTAAGPQPCGYVVECQPM